MEIKPEIMERLLSESDEGLWETIRKIAAANNVALPKTMPSEKDMTALRTVLKSGGLAYEDALGILERYRRDGRT